MRERGRENEREREGEREKERERGRERERNRGTIRRLTETVLSELTHIETNETNSHRESLYT